MALALQRQQTTACLAQMRRGMSIAISILHEHEASDSVRGSDGLGRRVDVVP
jgi:hypothetical protein